MTNYDDDAEQDQSIGLKHVVGIRLVIYIICVCVCVYVFAFALWNLFYYGRKIQSRHMFDINW